MSTIFAAADIVNITITISDVLSSSSEHIPKKLEIRHAYPNPFNNSLSINGSGHTEIYNLMGKKIKQINLNGTFRWNTSDLSSGIYKIINNKKTTTITLVK